MARIRSLKPEFFRSRSLAKCSREARLTFAGLWCEADDAGNGVYDSRILAGALWSLDDDIGWEQVEEQVHELVEVGAIQLYEVGSDLYYTIPNWTKHQSSAYRRGEPKFPPPSEGKILPPATVRVQPASEDVQEASVETEGLQLASVRVLEGKGEEGSREQGMELALDKPAQPKARSRDLVWDSLLAVCGVDLSQVTATARGRYNKAAKDLRDVQATPEAIVARGLVFRQRWPDASLTPSALASRWGECDPERQHAPVSRRDPERDMLRAQFGELGQ